MFRQYHIHWLTTALLTACCANFLTGCGKNEVAKDSEGAAAVQSLREDPAEKPLLEKDARRYLWDIEHLAFVAEQQVLPKFKKGLEKNDKALLAEFFAADFVGIPITAEPSQQTVNGPIHCQQLTQANRTTTASSLLSVDQFLDHLLAFRERLGTGEGECGASIGLVRWGPVRHGDMQGPWQSVWQIRLAGRKEGRPTEIVLRVQMDLETVDEELPQRTHWIHKAVVEQVTIVESDEPLMKDVTLASGIDNAPLHDNWRPGTNFISNTGGVYVSDYNQDGILDVLIEDHEIGARLYRGLGQSHFKDVTIASGLPLLPKNESPSWPVACWADLDGDGDEDLISEDKLFENRGDGTFREVTKLSNLLLTPTTGYAVADYDGDGRVDLYVCHSGAYRVGQRERSKVEWIDGGLGIDNVLWRNLGDWQFEDVTETTNTGGGGRSTFAAIWFDANNDGRPDLLPINEFGRNPVLIQQEKGRFEERPLDPIFDGLSMGVTAGDFDNDGQTDIYIANMYSKAGGRVLANVDIATYPKDVLAKIKESVLGSKLYRNRGDGTFDVMPPDRTFAAVGWAYGANFADFNGDGFADLYATAGFKSEKRGKPDG